MWEVKASRWKEEDRRQGANKGVLYKLVDASLAVAVNVSIFLFFSHRNTGTGAATTVMEGF